MDFLKKNWSQLVIIALFVLSFLGYLAFERIVFLKILIIAFVIFSIWRYIKYHSQDWFIILILFLGFFSLYSLYLGVNWSLGLIMLGALILLFFTYYCYIKEHDIYSLIYTVLVAIIGVEFFVTLIVWPIDPKDKSLILVGSFYFFTEIIKLKEAKQLNWKKTLGLGIIILVIILLIILTSNWYKQ